MELKKKIDKSTEDRNTKNQVFKRIGRKYRLIKIRSEQNNDHARIMHK